MALEISPGLPPTWPASVLSHQLLRAEKTLGVSKSSARAFTTS